MTLFARILRLSMENKREEVIKIAEHGIEKASPLPSRLFSQAAEAIKNNAEKKFKEAMVKLFFYHV